MKKPWKEIFKEVKERNEKIQKKREREVVTLEELLFSQRRILTTGCWIWTGKRTTGGYGTIYLPELKRNIRVHILSLAHFRPEEYEDKKGYQVNHRCNVKLCFNPYHLYRGTQKENMNDYIKANDIKQLLKPYLEISL